MIRAHQSTSWAGPMQALPSTSKSATTAGRLAVEVDSHASHAAISTAARQLFMSGSVVGLIFSLGFCPVPFRWARGSRGSANSTARPGTHCTESNRPPWMGHGHAASEIAVR